MACRSCGKKRSQINKDPSYVKFFTLIFREVNLAQKTEDEGGEPLLSKEARDKIMELKGLAGV